MKENYVKYLNHKHWQEVKEQHLPKDGECRLCGRKENLILHHKTYENIWQETEKDFIILCQRCHKKIHFKGRLKLCSAAVLNRYQKFYRRKRIKELGIYKPKPKKEFSCAVRYSKDTWRY